MEEKFKAIAAQLRQPHGEYAKEVGEKMNTGNSYINRYAIEALDILPHDVILEIGMGNGFFVKEILMKHPSVTYIGCDFSEIMVEEAIYRNEVFIESGQAAFYNTSADKLPVSDGSINKVMNVNSIYFWERPEDVLKEIGRVLIPGGKLITAIRSKEVMKELPFTQYGFTMYNSDDLKRLLIQSNFEVESIVTEPEPGQELNGIMIKVDSLICTAIKK